MHLSVFVIVLFCYNKSVYSLNYFSQARVKRYTSHEPSLVTTSAVICDNFSSLSNQNNNNKIFHVLVSFCYCVVFFLQFFFLQKLRSGLGQIPYFTQAKPNDSLGQLK